MIKTGWSVVIMFVCAIAVAQKPDTLPRLPAHYQSRMEIFKKEANQKGVILFLGNGLIEQGNWKTLMKDSAAINFGIEGDVTFGLLQRLKEVIALQPSRIFIEIGADDFSKRIPDDRVMENIFTIASRLKKRIPGAVIYVQSIFPVNPSAKTFPKGFDHNENTASVNDQLRKYAARLGYSYLNLFGDFANAKGQLDAKFSTDGVHLNSAGYAHWASLLKDIK